MLRAFSRFFRSSTPSSGNGTGTPVLSSDASSEVASPTALNFKQPPMDGYRYTARDAEKLILFVQNAHNKLELIRLENKQDIDNLSLHFQQFTQQNKFSEIISLQTQLHLNRLMTDLQSQMNDLLAGQARVKTLLDDRNADSILDDPAPMTPPDEDAASPLKMPRTALQNASLNVTFSPKSIRATQKTQPGTKCPKLPYPVISRLKAFHDQNARVSLPEAALSIDNPSSPIIPGT